LVGIRHHIPENARLYAALDPEFCRGLEFWLTRARDRERDTVAA